MTVRVTKKDIQNGIRHPWLSPIALAVTRAVNARAGVFSDRIAVRSKHLSHSTRSYPLPVEVALWDDAYYVNGTGEPFTFLFDTTKQLEGCPVKSYGGLRKAG